MKKMLLLSAALSPSIALAGHDLPIEIVEVVGEKVDTNGNIEMSSTAPLTAPVHDAGALLRSINGMDAARRGGRGFDPIIRGQSQRQINVINDGGYTISAGPGRMDPPTTYMGFDNFDKVIVIKGNRSVLYGAGGSGATLIFEHQRPDFSDKNIQGSVVGGYTSNSDIDSISANLAIGNDDAYVRVFGEHKSSGHYDDADGNTISAAFDSKQAGIIAGADITSKDYVEASVTQAREKDAFYAGNGMDAPYANADSVRLKWTHTGQILFLDKLEANAYRSDVVHLMNNYTLRDRNPMMMNGMETTTASDTWGGKLQGTINTESGTIKLGIDYLANDRKALMYMDMGKDGTLDMLGSYLWPDAEQRQIGVFAEWDYDLTEKDMVRLGMRYDQFELEATKADTMAGMMGMATPNMLYQNFYGTNDNEIENSDAGFVVGWDRKLDSDKLFSLNISRSVRNPDTNEVFMARRTMGAIPTHWVGNPDIQSEIHQQVDLTLMGNNGETNWSGTIFWNEVDDYIERFSDDQGNTLYRNISASIRGAEVEVTRQLTDSIRGRTALSYTRGEGDNGDLANIAPLTARINIDYQQETWGVGSEVIAADRQTAFNPDVDVNEETPGFGIMNVYSHWEAIDQLTLEAGVENLFDKNYAYHVNKASSDPFDPTAVRVNEPGRQFWVRVRYEL